MKCKECNLCWADKGEEFPSCKADPNWPAPCEYEEERNTMKNECRNCPHEGHGSEHCAATWGDYCPLAGEYILMTRQDEAEYFRIWGELPPREFVKSNKKAE